MKVLCPRHDDSLPSCEVYEDHGFCFVCHVRIPLEELGCEPSAPQPRRPPEDLVAKRSYIESLPTKQIRGFELHYDDYGYYLPYRGSLYYKVRRWNPPNDKDKYRSAVGHPKEIYWSRRGASSRLFLVEGDLNSDSIAVAFPHDDVCSPGSVGDFKSSLVRNFLLTYCTSYRTIVVIVDRDGPGTEAAIHAKGLLVPRVPDTRIVLCEPDPNELYCDGGETKLRHEIETRLRQAL